MLPEFYRICLQSQLSISQLHTLKLLVWLLQFQKQVRIERLAACLPLPILFESRRRHLQRFLVQGATIASKTCHLKVWEAKTP